MNALKAQLLAELHQIKGVEDRPSPVSGGSALFYRGKPFAHFHHDNELDARLGRKIIRGMRLAHPADSSHHPDRSPSSVWIELRYTTAKDVAYVSNLIRLAVEEMSREA